MQTTLLMVVAVVGLVAVFGILVALVARRSATDREKAVGLSLCIVFFLLTACTELTLLSRRNTEATPADRSPTRMAPVVKRYASTSPLVNVGVEPRKRSVNQGGGTIQRPSNHPPLAVPLRHLAPPVKPEPREDDANGDDSGQPRVRHESHSKTPPAYEQVTDGPSHRAPAGKRTSQNARG